jgi:hypothetical protein
MDSELRARMFAAWKSYGGGLLKHRRGTGEASRYLGFEKDDRTELLLKH